MRCIVVVFCLLAYSMPSAVTASIERSEQGPRTGGTVVAWGCNVNGQCNVPEPNVGFIAIAAGSDCSLALQVDGSIVAWGYNEHGQCNVPAPNEGFVAVAGGAFHSLGLKSDSTVVAWGNNDHGQCNVPEPNAGFVAIAGGGLHSLGLKSDGTIVAWGYNEDGQCNVPEPNTDFVALAGRFSNSLGLKSDGTIVVWGDNEYGQCDVPVSNADFVAIASGGPHSLGIKNDSTVVVWGNNWYGQCDVPAPNADFVAVSGGCWHSLGLKSDGTVAAWGLNDVGQCDVSEPNTDFVAVAGGYGHTLALKSFHLDTIYSVRPDGTGDYPTIQAAINAASDGDTIELADGIFIGEGNRDIDFRGKAVLVRSESGIPEACVIDCQASDADQHRGFYFHSGEQATAVLSGLTVVNGFITGNGNSNGGAGIRCDNYSSPTVTNCIFRGNTARLAWGGGADCSYSSPAFDNCTFAENAGISGGMSCDRAANATFIDCIFFRNSGTQAGGAHTWQCSPSFVRCTFVGNAGSVASGLFLDGYSSPGIASTIIAFGIQGPAVFCHTSSVTISCSDLYGNAGGDWVNCAGGQYGINGNISVDPLFCHSDTDDLHLRSDSPCAPAQSGGCGLIGALPVGCGIVPIIVRPDGTGDFPTIQAAIDSAAPIDTVLLANGRFTGEGNRDLDCHGKALVIRSQSGNPDSCIIDCEGSDSGPHRGLWFRSGEQGTSVLAGMTITGGYVHSGGGGISCEGASSPLISNCILVENVSESGGGGADCSESSAPTFEGCVFVRNEGVAGGMRCYNANASFTSCVFSANSGDQAGAGQTWNSSPSFVRCTIANNFGGTTSGLLLEAYSSPTIQNSIIAFGEYGPAIVCHNSAVELACCDLYGNQGGDWVGCAAGQNGRRGSFSADPCFCDAENGDYHLWNYSPCNQEGCGLIGAWPVGCEDPMAVGPVPVPEGLSLTVWPNPVGDAAEIRWVLPSEAGDVRLGIYDLAGRLVRSFEGDGQAGILAWDRADALGHQVVAGAYFLRLRVGEEEVTSRVLVVR